MGCGMSKRGILEHGKHGLNSKHSGLSMEL